MQQNVGVLDQVLRITIGFALIGVGFIAPVPWKFAAFAAGLAAIVSGFAGKCLLYRVLGVRTGARPG